MPRQERLGAVFAAAPGRGFGRERGDPGRHASHPRTGDRPGAIRPEMRMHVGPENPAAPEVRAVARRCVAGHHRGDAAAERHHLGGAQRVDRLALGGCRPACRARPPPMPHRAIGAAAEAVETVCRPADAVRSLQDDAAEALPAAPGARRSTSGATWRGRCRGRSSRCGSAPQLTQFGASRMTPPRLSQPPQAEPFHQRCHMARSVPRAKQSMRFGAPAHAVRRFSRMTPPRLSQPPQARPFHQRCHMARVGAAGEAVDAVRPPAHAVRLLEDDAAEALPAAPARCRPTSDATWRVVGPAGEAVDAVRHPSSRSSGCSRMTPPRFSQPPHALPFHQRCHMALSVPRAKQSMRFGTPAHAVWARP